jgi:methylmalonyl-CoA/ethylmalonyl-CoA epimerase
MVEKRKFVLPKLHHIGVAVKDIEKAAEYYSSNFGVGPFMFLDVDLPGTVTSGKSTPLKLKVGMAQMGDVIFELIQDVGEGRSARGEPISRRPRRPYHLGFLVDDLSQALTQLKRQGISVFEEGGAGNNRFAFVGSDKEESVIFELMQLEPGLLK